MAADNVLTGHRVQLAVVNPDTNTAVVRGIFMQGSCQVVQPAEPLTIMGRSGPAGIVRLGQEAVTGTLSGYRSLDHGPHQDGEVPRLGDLLTAGDIQLIFFDRQSKRRVGVVQGTVLHGFSVDLANRAPHTVQIPFIGMSFDDESGIDAEAPGASELP